VSTEGLLTTIDIVPTNPSQKSFVEDAVLPKHDHHVEDALFGSAYELERQQGMAHLIELVSFMGSPKVALPFLLF